jgi:hypothetical protein
VREIKDGDVIRMRRSKDFKKPLSPRRMAMIDKARESRYFELNMFRSGYYYVYSILYLVVDVESQMKVHVCRLDRHAGYRVSPYTWVSMNYLQGGTLVREGVDVSSLPTKRHPLWGYQGCLDLPVLRSK